MQVRDAPAVRAPTTDEGQPDGLRPDLVPPLPDLTTEPDDPPPPVVGRHLAGVPLERERCGLRRVDAEELLQVRTVVKHQRLGPDEAHALVVEQVLQNAGVLRAERVAERLQQVDELVVSCRHRPSVPEDGLPRPRIGVPGQAVA
jgi:hypothetical protein